LKHGWHVLRVKAPESHPAGVRGLKLLNPEIHRYHFERSHPAGVRGLKLAKAQKVAEGEGVAPRRGAWIETLPPPNVIHR